MKKEDIIGIEVEVVLPEGERFDCFVAAWDRTKGITLKLIDNDTAPKWLGKEEDGSYNLLCINKYSKNPAYGPYYEGFFHHVTKKILTGTVSIDTHYRAIEGINLAAPWFTSMMKCAF